VAEWKRKSRNVQFYASSRKSAALRVGILPYAVKAMPDLSRQAVIDAENSGIGPFMGGN
jgi:hypothetical protein